MRSSLCLLLLIAGSSAFTSNVQRPLNPSLSVGIALDWNSQEDEAFLMEMAEACASDDTCSLEDAQNYLDNVIRIQSGCSSGSLLGNNVCEDVNVAAGIVAQLREKIERESQRLRLLSVSTTLVNAVLVLVFLTASISGMTHNDPNVSPFTAQEWWWAIRDGYLPVMLSEYFRNGGFLISDIQPETTPFTLQELWWSLKGGYVDTLVSHFFKNGGLAGEDQLTSAPFTPMEWMWAAQNGFLDQITSQNFVHGGLTDVSLSEVDTLPITPQEWTFAARDGYLDALTSAYLKSGGV